MCIFIGCWPWSIQGLTHADDLKSTSDHFSRFVFLSNVPQNGIVIGKNEKITFFRALVITSQKTLQRIKNNSHATLLRLVTFCSLHTVTSCVVYYSTHARKNVIYLLNRHCHATNICCCKLRKVQQRHFVAWQCLRCVVTCNSYYFTLKRACAELLILYVIIVWGLRERYFWQMSFKQDAR